MIIKIRVQMTKVSLIESLAKNMRKLLNIIAPFQLIDVQV